MFQCSVENLRAPEKIVPTDFLLKILAFFTQTQKMDFLKPAKILPHWREASALTIELKISIFSGLILNRVNLMSRKHSFYIRIKTFYC